MYFVMALLLMALMHIICNWAVDFGKDSGNQGIKLAALIVALCNLVFQAYLMGLGIMVVMS